MSLPPTDRSSPHQQPIANPWLVLAVLCTAIFMLLLDTTIVNVAQVKIKADLGASLTQIQWVLDLYILTYAVLLLTLGRLGDVFGRKRMFTYGMTIFTAASLYCAGAQWLGERIGVDGVTMLIIARILQGVGGAFMMPQSLSLLTVAFPPEKRGAAMGIWGSVTALGAVVGPVLGGLIVTNFAWEWVFLINLPVGIFAIAMTRRIVPESRDPHASSRIDVPGVALSSAGIFLVVYALIEASHAGWTSTQTLGLLAAGGVLMVAFVLWERRAADPMMKIELFRIRNFWVGNVIGFAISFGMLGIFFPMTIFLQQVLGFTPIRAGLTMSPLSITIMLTAPWAGRLVDRIGARYILFAGLSLTSGGIVFLITQIDLASSWPQLMPALMMIGAGMGLTFAPMTAAAMRDVPPRIAGSASGIINTTRNVGQVLGIAVLGSVLQSRIAVHAVERLDGIGLDPAVESQVVAFARQFRLQEIQALVTAPDQLGAVYAGLDLGFVDALHNTFIVGAATCAAAALVALLMRNYRGVPVASRPAAPAPAPAAAPAAD
jgi:EmrB/QacA subfamily drug resistance transporter